MGDDIRSRIQVFDPQQEFAVVERRLPHWTQAGTVCFITWRTWDSMPEPVLQAWVAERDEWLKRNGIDVRAPDWREQVLRLPPALPSEFQRIFSDRWNEHLDDCHGACVLKRRELASIMKQSLLHFDGDRYDLTDFVVMPNHVHLLAAFPDETAMLRQCESWKHFTAARINRALGRRGRFWQTDGFDHLVRSVDQFDYFRRYIVDNPRRARLRDDEFVHFSKKL